jgi:hypothetical protein
MREQAGIFEIWCGSDFPTLLKLHHVKMQSLHPEHIGHKFALSPCFRAFLGGSRVVMEKQTCITKYLLLFE